MKVTGATWLGPAVTLKSFLEQHDITLCFGEAQPWDPDKTWRVWLKGWGFVGMEVWSNCGGRGKTPEAAAADLCDMIQGKRLVSYRGCFRSEIQAPPELAPPTSEEIDKAARETAKKESKS